MTRVLHIINGLGSGGAEAMLTRLLLLPENRDQQVVSLLPGGANAERLRAAGVAVTELDLRQPVALVWRLIRLIRDVRPDVVQSWMYYADLAALFGLLLSGRRGQTRLIWGIRCSDMRLDLYRLHLRLATRLGAFLSGLPDIVSVNSAAGRQVHERMGYRPKRWALVHNGIETDRFAPDPARRAAMRESLGVATATPLIACIARNDAMKDYPGFLAMLDRLPGVMAYAAGTGTQLLPDHPRLLRLGRRLDVPDLLCAADLLVSASAFGEGFSNAIGEAMASALPVVATDVGDARHIIGDTGLVVPPGNPDALAEAVKLLLAEPEAARLARGASARARISALFSLERAAAAFAALHEGAAAGGRRHAPETPPSPEGA